ncbi:hypothetical protein BDR05DRAFT_988548 [Suillus weaverae]|nr:hypothetical protein BDR05DRAFT_988548 [Suillus weaverae]
MLYERTKHLARTHISSSHPSFRLNNAKDANENRLPVASLRSIHIPVAAALSMRYCVIDGVLDELEQDVKILCCSNLITNVGVLEVIERDGIRIVTSLLSCCIRATVDERSLCKPGMATVIVLYTVDQRGSPGMLIRIRAKAASNIKPYRAHPSWLHAMARW